MAERGGLGRGVRLDGEEMHAGRQEEPVRTADHDPQLDEAELPRYLILPNDYKRVTMPVGWIDDIYNNTDFFFRLQSIDKEHNGELRGDDGATFKLDDGNLHAMFPHAHYHASWCGIPWYYKGEHYKALGDTNGLKAIHFYQSQIDEANWVFFLEGHTGRQIGRTRVSMSADYHCVLRFETTGIFLDVVSDDGSTQDSQHQIWDATKGWVNASTAELAEQLIEALGGGVV